MLIKNKKGISQVFLLILVSLLALSLPLATKLVNQSQDSRSKAADDNVVTDFNFKIAFKGIKPDYSCLSSITSLTAEVINTTTNTYDSVESTSLEPITDEVNNDGDQVFKVTIPINYTKFSNSNTSNYLRLRTSDSLANRYCTNNQDTTIDSTDNCNININDSVTVYDFSNYPLTPGDLNQDDLINSLDYLTIKNNISPDTDITCNQTGDLNYDGIVNSLDSTLIKNVLTQTSEELLINDIQPTNTITSTPTLTNTPTLTPTTAQSSNSTTIVVQPTSTKTPTPTPTLTPTNTPTLTPTKTNTPTPTNTPTSTLTPTPTTPAILTGTATSSNSTLCQNQNGICASYSTTLSANNQCKVSGYSDTGTILTSICSGDSKTYCCGGINTENGVLLKFAVMADIHDNNTGLKKMLKTSIADGINITVIAGDLTHDGTTSQLKATKNVLDNSGADYIATEGNHDMRKSLFDDVFGKSFQSVKINGVKLIVIDNSDYRGLESGVLKNSGQKAWIESEVVECKNVICIGIMHMPLNHDKTSDHVMGEDSKDTAVEAVWLRKLLVNSGVKEIEVGHIHHFDTYTINGLKTNQVGPGTSSDFSEFTVYSDGSIDRKKIYN